MPQVKCFCSPIRMWASPPLMTTQAPPPPTITQAPPPPMTMQGPPPPGATQAPPPAASSYQNQSRVLTWFFWPSAHMDRTALSIWRPWTPEETVWSVEDGQVKTRMPQRSSPVCWTTWNLEVLTRWRSDLGRTRRWRTSLSTPVSPPHPHLYLILHPLSYTHLHHHPHLYPRLQPSTGATVS